MAAGKTSFAEQLAQRCKPLFEELRDEVSEKGIEKFDSYIKTINDVFDSQVGDKVDKLSEDVKTLFEGLGNDIETIKDFTGPSEDSEGADKSSGSDVSDLESAVRKSKSDLGDGDGKMIGVIDLVAQLKTEFEDKLKKDEEQRKQDEKDLKKEKKKADDKDKKNDKSAKAAKSTAARNSKLLDKINKKVHESKLMRIIKWIGIILGGAFLFPMLKPIWYALWSEVAAFFGYSDMSEMWTDIKTKVTDWVNENVPIVAEAIDWMKEKGESILNVCQNIWKGLEVIAGILKVPKATWDLITHPGETLKNAAESHKYIPQRDSFGNLTGWEINPAYVQAHPEEFISAESMAEGAATAEAAINAISVPDSTPVTGSQSAPTESTTQQQSVLAQFPVQGQDGTQKASSQPSDDIKQSVSQSIAGAPIMPNFYAGNQNKDAQAQQQQPASGSMVMFNKTINNTVNNIRESSIEQ